MDALETYNVSVTEGVSFVSQIRLCKEHKIHCLPWDRASPKHIAMPNVSKKRVLVSELHLTLFWLAESTHI